MLRGVNHPSEVTHDVLVDGHGEGDAGVAEPLAHDLRVHVLLEQDRGVGVPEVVEPNAGHVGLGDGAFEGLADEVGMYR